MTTEHGPGNRPDNEDLRKDTGDTNPTEPIRGPHPTEPIRGPHPTEPIRGRHPTEPIGNTHTTKPVRGTGPQKPVAAEGKSAGTALSRDRRPRVATIVWGLIVISLAVLLTLGQVTSISLNMGQVVIGLLLGAGLALVLGGIISAGTRGKDDKRA